MLGIHEMFSLNSSKATVLARLWSLLVKIMKVAIVVKVVTVKMVCFDVYVQILASQLASCRGW
eukprot:210637-Amphidinium_carterae.1